MDKPELHCITARVYADGTVVHLTAVHHVTPLADAAQMRTDDSRLVLLIDPIDEIALAQYNQINQPLNPPRVKGSK